MPSTVDIANFALNNLGASNITTLDENSKAARIINQRYDAVRDAVFRAHPWNCLIRRAQLAQETDTPVFGYAKQYALPTEPFCLRVLEFSNGSLSYPQDNMTSNTGGPVFVIEGRKLLTDEGTARIKYIGRVTDPKNMMPALSKHLRHVLLLRSAMRSQALHLWFKSRLRCMRLRLPRQGLMTRLRARPRKLRQATLLKAGTDGTFCTSV